MNRTGCLLSHSVSGILLVLCVPCRSVRRALSDLSWQTQLLSFQHFCYVEIKEITVQDCLNDACHDGDHVEEAFEVEAPDPIHEIQGAIEAEEEQVVSGDGLGFSGLADHEQLWEDGHGLQVDGERPHDLQRREVMVDEEGQAADWDDQELCSERVVVAIIRGLELHVYQVNRGIGTCDIDNLHGGVVQRNEGCEKVQIASGEHQGKQNLTLPRYSCTRPGFPYLQQEDDDGC